MGYEPYSGVETDVQHSLECLDRCDLHPCACGPVMLFLLHDDGRQCIGTAVDAERLILDLRTIVDALALTEEE